jgi:predicted transcriptional regulator
VIPCKISRVDYGLRFVEDECCAESSLIGRQCLPPDKVESIRLLSSLQGASKRLIAKVVGVSPATVSKIIGKYGAKEVPEEDEATPNPQNPQTGIEESDAEFEEIPAENPSQAEPENSVIVCEASNRERPCNLSDAHGVTSKSGVQTHEASSTALVPQSTPQTTLQIIPKLSDYINTAIFRNEMLKMLLNQAENYSPVPYKLEFTDGRNNINDFLIQKALARGIPIPPRYLEPFHPVSYIQCASEKKIYPEHPKLIEPPKLIE